MYFTDVKIESFASPVGVSETPVNSNVEVVITNNGTTTINEATVQWSVNGLGQSPVNLVGLNLAPNTSILVNLGAYNFNQVDFYTIQAEIEVDSDFEPANNVVETIFEVSPSNDAEVVGFTPESTVPGEGIREVKITIKNNGANAIDSIIVDWSVNGMGPNTLHQQ